MIKTAFLALSVLGVTAAAIPAAQASSISKQVVFKTDEFGNRTRAVRIVKTDDFGDRISKTRVVKSDAFGNRVSKTRIVKTDGFGDRVVRTKIVLRNVSF